MKPVTPWPVRESIHPDTLKTHLGPTLLLNLSNLGSKFRVFSHEHWCCQDTDSSWNDRRQQKFSLHLGEKKNWLPVHFTNTELHTLMDVLGKQWLQNLPGHEEADRKHREQPWVRPVPGHTEHVPPSGTLPPIPLLREALRWGWAQPPTPAVLRNLNLKLKCSYMQQSISAQFPGMI